MVQYTEPLSLLSPDIPQGCYQILALVISYPETQQGTLYMVQVTFTNSTATSRDPFNTRLPDFAYASPCGRKESETGLGFEAELKLREADGPLGKAEGTAAKQRPESNNGRVYPPLRPGLTKAGALMRHFLVPEAAAGELGILAQVKKSHLDLPAARYHFLQTPPSPEPRGEKDGVLPGDGKRISRQAADAYCTEECHGAAKGQLRLQPSCRSSIIADSCAGQRVSDRESRLGGA